MALVTQNNFTQTARAPAAKNAVTRISCSPVERTFSQSAGLVTAGRSGRFEKSLD